MQTVLIADRSDDICFVLKKQLQPYFQVSTCSDGLTALALTRGMRPDALVLDLRLPKLDGFALLEQLQGQLPPAVLAISDTGRDYDHYTAINLGAGHVIQRPFNTGSIYLHIKLLLDYAGKPERPAIEPRAIAAAHLNRLGFDVSHAGTQQLRIAIALFRQDPGLSLSKDLYPGIAPMWNTGDGRLIERTMRAAIESAWKNRNPAVWEEYFPGFTECPSNKKFIAHMADFTQMPEK